MGTFNIGDYVPYLDWMDLQGVNRRLKSVHNAQDYFLEKVIDEHAARNDPNAPKDLVDVLLAEAANQDAGLQISRDWIKAVLYVC